MPWFWGSKKDGDSEEEDDEYDSEDEYSDEDDEEYELEEDDGESEDGSYEEVEEEEKISGEGDRPTTADASHSDAIVSEPTTKEDEPANANNNTAAAETKKPPNGSALKKTTDVTNGTGIDKGYIHEFEDDEDDDDTDGDNHEIHLERIESGVPDQVLGNRHRAPSALTLGETDDEEGSNGSIMDESTHSEASQEQEENHVTTLAEKQSLLVLAAEHDRVDILNSVLSEAAEKDELLHGGIPPLHIAILNGSINTATCLLRMGADPGVRPNVKDIAQNQDPSAPLDVPKQIDGVTAWELAFDKNIVPKAKQQGLMNAFSAEALRCMGSDEGVRLQQLLKAGMPSDMPIMGDKSLYDWAVELGAPQCEEVLRPTQAAKHNIDNTDDSTVPNASPVSGGKSAVLDRPGSEETTEQLTRQLEELESLAKALSTCLDSLAEEVSVSHGLLLMGGGASALASHVRSLKSLKDQKSQELARHQESFENTQDELDYWVNQAGPRGQAIANEEAPASVTSRRHSIPPKFASAAEENSYCENLHQKIVATNEKIRKFRVSIADLSEENDRNMQEVEKRGLTGGINLVRGLKDEIREIDFSLEETKLADSVYRAKVEKIQAVLNSKDEAGGETNSTGEETSVAGTSRASTEHHFNHANGVREAPQESDSFSDIASDQSGDMKPSERIATGHSTALALRTGVAGPGLFPLSLWQILLRIMGLRDQPPTPPPRRRQSSGTFTSSAQPAMIV